MEKRYKLPVGLQRKYLLDVENDLHISANELSKIFNVSERSLRSWKNESVPIPVIVVSAIEKISRIPFPCSKQEAQATWKARVSNRAKKGGFARLEKHGDIGTKEGRSRGGKTTLTLLRKSGIIPAVKPFIVPEVHSEQLAEFIGIMLGDGHLGPGQWTITLNSIADKNYCDFVIKLVENLFGFSPGRYMRKDANAIVIYGGGIEYTRYLDHLGLKVGNKVSLQVAVPGWILQNAEFRRACLRGLIDTDGGIFLHSYKVKGKKYQYKKLSFANRSIPLINFVYDSLCMLQLQPRLRLNEPTKRVWLYGEMKTYQYLRIVGSHNQRLLRHGGVG